MWKVVGEAEFVSPVFETIEDAQKWMRAQVESAGQHCTVGAYYSHDGAITITVVSGTYKETFRVVKVEDEA